MIRYHGKGDCGLGTMMVNFEFSNQKPHFFLLMFFRIRPSAFTLTPSTFPRVKFPIIVKRETKKGHKATNAHIRSNLKRLPHRQVHRITFFDIFNNRFDIKIAVIGVRFLPQSVVSYLRATLKIFKFRAFLVF